MPRKVGILYDKESGQFLEVELDESGNVLRVVRPLDLRTEVGPAIMASYFRGTLLKDGVRVSPEQFGEILAALGGMIRQSLGNPTDTELGNALRAAYTDDPRVVGFVYAMDSQFAQQIWPMDVIGQSLDELEFVDDDSVAPSTVKSTIAPKVGAGTTQDVQGVGPATKGNGTCGGAATQPGGKVGGAVDGKPNVDSNGDGATSTTGNKTGGDPVLLASGAFFHQVTDLMVPARGLHFAFTRTYINQMVYKGPLGYSWDHSYNLWLRERQEIHADGTLRNVVYRSTGQVREDPYVQLIAAPAGDLSPLSLFADATFEGPPGYFDRLEKSGGRYVLESPRGVRIEYGESLFAERIVDPHGNTIHLHYDGQLLTEIVDPVGKRLTLRYDTLNRLTNLRDEVGQRELRYSYSSHGDLEEADLVLADLVIGTDYRYTGPEVPVEMQHNLIEVISPTGESVLQVEYGEDWKGLDYNRVVRQRAEDGEIEYEYGLAPDGDVDPALDPDNVPMSVTRVRYQNGHVIDYVFNRQGNVVRRLEKVLSATGVIETLVGQYRYNADGNIVEQVRPDGLRLEWRYQREWFASLHGGDASGASPAERRAFGNLVKTIVHPRAGLGETRRIVTDLDYTPANRLARQRGPYFATVELHEIPGQRVAEIRYEYDARGNLLRALHGEVTLPGGGRRTVAPITNTYDEHGQLVVITNGLTSARFTYFDDLLRSGFLREVIEDPDGLALRTAHEVDTLGRATRIIGPWGAVLDTEWTDFDAPHRIVGPEVTPGRRAVTTFLYDKHRKPVRIEEQLLLCDGAPHPATTHVTALKYDRYSRRTEMGVGGLTDPGRRVAQTVFLPTGLPVRTIDARGTITKTDYDQRLFVKAVTVAHGRSEAATTRFRYGRAGELIETEDARGRRTRYDYDAFGRVARVHGPDGTLLEWEHDPTGHVTRARLTGSHPETAMAVRWSESEFGYDELGRLIERRDHVFVPGESGSDAIATSQVVFDPFGRVSHTIDALGGMARREYDSLNRLLRTIDAEGNDARIVYDDVAHTATTTLTEMGEDEQGRPLSQCTTHVFAFDGRGVLSAITDALGRTTRHAYDSRGQPCATTLPDGTVHKVDYDAFGQVVRVASPVAGGQVQTIHEYDAAGNVIRLVNPLGGVIHQTFDALNRMVATERDDGTAATLRYDSLGRITRYLDENGVALNLGYGSDGRLRSEEYDLTGFVVVPELPQYRPQPIARREYSYTPRGDLARVRDAEGEVVYRFDSLGRVLEERTAGHRMSFGRDLLGRLVAFRYPGGRELRFDLSPLGKLRAIRQQAVGTGYPGDLTRPPQRDLLTLRHVGSRASLIRFGDSHTALVRYDPTFRQIGMDWRRVSDHAPLGGERVLYGSRGEVRIHQLDTRTRILDYDSLLRLVSSQDVMGHALVNVAGLAPAPSQAELADAPSQATVDGIAASLRAALASQPTDRATEYTLDDNGNRLRTRESTAGVTTQIDYLPTRHDQYQSVGGSAYVYDRVGNLLADGEYRYAYDTAHALIGIVTQAGEVRIGRDQLGRINRVRRPGLDREIVHAGWRMLEWRQAGVVAGQLVPLLRPNQIAHVAADGQEFAPVFDVMDSVTAWITANGTKAGATSYDPFGRVLTRSGDWPAPFGYGGFLEDGLSSIKHLLARGYRPSEGRFLQRDPQGFVDGLNRYAFARNAPLTMTDHFGFKAAEIDWGIAGLGLGTTLFSAGMLLAMFYMYKVASTLTPQGRAATIMATMLSYVLGKALSDAFTKNVTDAEKSGASVPGAVALSVGDAVLPIRSSYEAFTGKSFYPTEDRTYLSKEERSLSVGHAAGGALLSALLPVLALSRRAPPTNTRGAGEPVAAPPAGSPPPDPSIVAVADQGDAAATLAGAGRAYASGAPEISSFSYGVAAGAEKLLLALHGVMATNARGTKRGAWGVAVSDLLARKLGLLPPLRELPPPGTPPKVMSPELLAMYTVDYLKFKGSFVDLSSCGTGYFSSHFNQAFIEVYAQVLAQYLKHPVTVKGPRGLLYADPQTGVSMVKPNPQSPSLPVDEAFATTTAE